MAIIVKFGKKSQEVTRATCSPAEEVGTWVYKDGEVDGLDWVRMADPTDLTKLPAIGVIILKESLTICRVQWSGETPEIFSGLDTKTVYHLGNDSKLSYPPPVPASGSFIYWQMVAVAVTDKKVRIKTVPTMTKMIDEL